MKDVSKPEQYDFFAFLSRMRYISRWGLMRNTVPENIQEHSLDVAVIAHALVLIRNTYFDGTLDPSRAALYGIFHDASEIFTGDMPTPVKHFNPHFKRSFHQLEDRARRKLLAMLPPELAREYEPLFFFDDQEEYARLVKAADRIAALTKCIEEGKSGNREIPPGGNRAFRAAVCQRAPRGDLFSGKTPPRLPVIAG